MKAKRGLTILIVAWLITGTLSPSDVLRWTLLGGATAEAAPQSVDIGFFYEELTPYGYWRPYKSYGWVWYPDVDDHWRPYTTGYWVFTNDYGWIWISSEPWGWVAFHYGRWFLDEDYGGWAWVPDTEWGPAWVSWRSGDGFVGWAPLPPRTRFRPGVGFSPRDLEYEASSYAWCFVPIPLFLSPRVEQVIVPPPRNPTIIHNTVNITHYTVINRRVINRGIDVDLLEREIRTPVVRYRTLDVDRPVVGRHSIRDERVPLFRPQVVETAHGNPLPPSGFAPYSTVRPDISPPRAVPGRNPQEPHADFPDQDQGDFVAPGQGERYRSERTQSADTQPRPWSTIPRSSRPPKNEVGRTTTPPPLWSTIPRQPRSPKNGLERTTPTVIPQRSAPQHLQRTGNDPGQSRRKSWSKSGGATRSP